MYRASVAQWLEHWSRKPGVKSSNLFWGYIQLFTGAQPKPKAQPKAGTGQNADGVCRFFNVTL